MASVSLANFLSTSKDKLRKGPVALIFVEDDCEITSTLHHHLSIGFKHVLAFMPDAYELEETLAQQVHRIRFDIPLGDNYVDAVNQVIAAAHDAWLYYCFNAEYLFFPFCETRLVGEMLTFHTEERRDSMMTYVVDLYANDLSEFPAAVSIENAHLDKSGYYALARWNEEAGEAHDRQFDFYGGLRWRFEEHIPFEKRRIDRISLFRAKPNLHLLENHTFDDQEYNTYACQWHHNLTAAVCSFRAAKALRRNPGSREAIHQFHWHNSVPFEWHSRQLLDLGLMEPGQWF